MKQKPNPTPMLNALINGTFGEKYLGEKPAPIPAPARYREKMHRLAQRPPVSYADAKAQTDAALQKP